MSACRESELDALLADELSPEEAARVRAHANTCPACQHALSWLRAERGWMAQRARRTPVRPALDFAALEARLQKPAAPPWEPRPAGWLYWRRMLTAATAVVAFVGLSTLQVTRIPSADDPWSQHDAFVTAARPVDWCDDPSREAVAALEARVGACLVATPLLPLR
ncbi:anti-sigma factor family protein [Myxococcus sp. Y35]|uniref:anti-sigma factor family protein n=1 Tax=Pseudomyxococcus flavus TaxID=3115648 RepID=UPI003CE9AC3C